MHARAQAQAASALRTLTLYLMGRSARRRHNRIASFLLICIILTVAPDIVQQSGMQQVQLQDSDAAVTQDFIKALADHIQQIPPVPAVPVPPVVDAASAARWQQAVAMSSHVVNAARALFSGTPPAGQQGKAVLWEIEGFRGVRGIEL